LYNADVMTSPSAVASAEPAIPPARSELVPSHDPRLRSWIAFLRAHAAVTRRLESELQEAQGLSLADYDALLQLSRAPSARLRMNELADRLVLTRSGVSRLVDRLVLDGFVERARCSTDARGAFAVLTPSGRQRLEAAVPTHLRGVAEHFLAGLPEEDREPFTHALEQVLARLEGSRAAPQSSASSAACG
jgi:DNA-binding MarR family transcriptional regulator